MSRSARKCRTLLVKVVLEVWALECSKNIVLLFELTQLSISLEVFDTLAFVKKVELLSYNVEADGQQNMSTTLLSSILGSRRPSIPREKYFEL